VRHPEDGGIIGVQDGLGLRIPHETGREDNLSGCGLNVPLLRGAGEQTGRKAQSTKRLKVFILNAFRGFPFQIGL
jgi:hypothetical protein